MKPNFAFSNTDDGAGAGMIPTRDQIALADTWDLTLLYGTPEKWSEDFECLHGIYPDIAQFKGHVGQSAQTLRDVLEFDKALNLKIERLYHYAMLKMSENSSDDANLRREGQLQNLLTRIGEAGSYGRLSPSGAGGRAGLAADADRSAAGPDLTRPVGRAGRAWRQGEPLCGVVVL